MLFPAVTFYCKPRCSTLLLPGSGTAVFFGAKIQRPTRAYQRNIYFYVLFPSLRRNLVFIYGNKNEEIRREQPGNL